MKLKIKVRDIEKDSTFKYLGGVINKGTLQNEIQERIPKTKLLHNVSNNSIPPEVKAEVIKTVVKLILSYTCDSLTTNRCKRNKVEKHGNAR